MCDPFEITFTGTPEDLIAKATTKLEVQGGTLTGNVHSGKLSLNLPIVGLIEGTYTISGQVISLTITQKPVLLPCNLIEQKIRDIVNS